MMLCSHLKFLALSRSLVPFKLLVRITPGLHNIPPINSNPYFSRNIRSISVKSTLRTANFSKDHNFLAATSNGRDLTGFFAPSVFSYYAQQTRRSSSQRVDLQEKSIKSDGFIQLYFLDNIRLHRLLCRLSKYSFLMFLFGSPVCIMSSFMDTVPLETLRSVFSFLTIYMIFFTGQSFLLSSRVVAKIMINPEQDMLKISRLSLFGNRKDLYIKPSDIVKFPFIGPQLMSKTFLVLKFHNKSNRLLFFPSQGSFETNHEALELLLCSEQKE